MCNSSEGDRPRASDAGDWQRLYYQLAHSDIRWSKEQGWRVVNWALLLYGAVITIAQFMLHTVSSLAFIVIGVFVAIVAIIWLVDLHSFGSKSRQVCRDISKSLPRESKHPSGEGSSDRHNFYLVIQLIVIIMGLVLFIVAVPILKQKQAEHGQKVMTSTRIKQPAAR